MNCQYCHTKHRKFYCTDCIKEKLDKHEQEHATCLLEKNTVVAKASEFIEKATLIQGLIAEKNKRLQHIETIRETQKNIEIACNTKHTRIQQLQSQIRDKKKLLEESLKRKSQFDNPPDNHPALKAWQRTHKMTVGTRRILVKEITSLFELKPGLIEEPETPALQQDLPAFSKPCPPIEADLYICGVTLSTRLIDVSKVPKEELNAPIGLVIHMLGLIVRYLGIKLPFDIIRRGIRPYIKAPQRLQHTRKFPLFLEDDDKNFKKFIHGIAMLNYDIVYICHTQGIQIPINQVANTLQGLITICRAPGLGIKSHALYYQHIRDLDCPIEYDQVLRATTLRFRCSSSLERSQSMQSTNTIPTSNNELHDDFFKVQSSSTQNSTNNGERIHESEEEEEFGLYVDSDDDDEYAYKDKQQEDQPTNETWSLVEVAPFAVGGRAAHNGTDNIFQIGAASFMPGVMNMMESLGASTSNQAYYKK